MDKRSGVVRMKTFNNFCQEAYDPEIQKRSQIKTMGDGGRIRPDRKKTEPEKRRMKAAGGGKMVPAKDYKPRKDIGQQKQQSDRIQVPTKERGSEEVKKTYADKAKEERKKAAQARIAARKSGGEVKKDTTSARDKEKTASKLLTKKTTQTTSPDYKPAKASGMTRAERMKINRKGETKLRNIMKDQETSKYKKETGANPDAKGRTKIMGRVHKRMSESASDPEHYTTYGSGSSPSSGTQGGTKASFKKRPSTGLGNAAKNAFQSVKNAGKNALSKQKPKDTTYRGDGVGRKERVRDKVTSIVKKTAQKRLAGAPSRPQLGTARRPDLIRGSKPKPQISGSPQRKQISGSPQRTQISGSPQRKQISGSPQRKQISSGPNRPALPASTSSGLAPAQSQKRKELVSR